MVLTHDAASCVSTESRRTQEETREQSAPAPVAVELPGEPAPHTFQELYLYAFATQAEVIRHLRTEAAREEVDRLPEIMETWQRLQVRVTARLEGERRVADTIRWERIPAEHDPWLETLAADTLFQKTFQHLPVSFALVEADKLVAPQRTVNLTYVEKLGRALPASPTLPELLDICLGPKRSLDPIQYLEARSNSHVFSSPHSDIRFLGSYVKDITPDDFQYAESGGVPTAAVIAFVGYGYAPINVFHVGDRMILNNGFHRVYALRSRGVSHIPAVVQHVHNVELEFPHAVAGLPREYLLNVRRPVLIKDFFEPGFTIPLKVQQRLKVVKVGVSASSYDIPT